MCEYINISLSSLYEQTDCHANAEYSANCYEVHRLGCNAAHIRF